MGVGAIGELKVCRSSSIDPPQAVKARQKTMDVVTLSKLQVRNKKDLVISMLGVRRMLGTAVVLAIQFNATYLNRSLQIVMWCEVKSLIVWHF